MFGVVKFKLFFICCFLIGLIWGTQVKAQKFDNQEVISAVRLMFDNLDSSNFRIKNEPIFSRNIIKELYISRSFKLIWNQDLADRFIKELRLVNLHGLNGKDYHQSALNYYHNLNSEFLNLQSMVENDILLTDAFLLYCSHMIAGKVNPVSLEPRWTLLGEYIDFNELINKYSETNNNKVFFDELAPNFKSYEQLKRFLKLYEEIDDNGGWGRIDAGETLKKEMKGNRVLQLRNRLTFTESVDLRNDSSDLFDDSLVFAVKKFQYRHGLNADGIVGEETLKALNVSVKERIQSIIINLERCRWLPRNLGDKYIMVNIPAFELEVISKSTLLLKMKVAIGRPFRKTPVFSSAMTYMVFNPYWTVPPTILYQDMIPEQIKNPNYLKSLKIEIVDDLGNIIDPNSIDWTNYQKSGFPYTLRQEPGKNNAMGEVKFIFPNAYNVYMHDTNHPELFDLVDRAYSSGCIRLSKPIELANLILAEEENWTTDKVNEILKTNKNYTVVLTNPYPVHIQYWTAFVDENGILNFRKDIYERDYAIGKALSSN